MVGLMRRSSSVAICLYFAICIKETVMAPEEAWVSHAGMHMMAMGHRLRAKRATVVNKLTPVDQQDILQAHNEYRRLEPASDMEQMKWNTELADMAQEWADTCNVRIHGNPNTTDPPFTYIGQNLAVFYQSYRPSNFSRAVELWYAEYQFYNYDNNTCEDNKVCGHYTQVVWAKTTDIGCGYADCGDKGQNVVCNYGPGGNLNGNRPYQLGYPCSNCQSEKLWCNRNLCNSQCTQSGPECECAALCQNCGTKNEATCQCECADGWFGIDCTTRCEDQDPSCGANPGYPAFWCTDPNYPQVYRKCLVMCNRCVYKPDAPTCPEVTPCSEWSEWDTSNCHVCGGCGSRNRTRQCEKIGLSVEIDNCDPKYCVRGVHPKIEWLWITSKWNGKRKYIGRHRKCCYDFRAFWGTPHHLSRPKYCFAKRVQGWKDP